MRRFLLILAVSSLIAGGLVPDAPAAGPASQPISQESRLMPWVPAGFDSFGYSLAVSGDRAVVGAPGDDDRGANSGSVYVYSRSSDGWTQLTKLAPATGDADDHFGTAVGISGTTIVVGAPGAGGSGAAYVFVPSADGWAEQSKLTAVDAASADFFGRAVAVSGDTVVVGAYGDDDNGSASGSAYVFTRSGTTWSQQQKLLPAGGSADDYFGESVAIDDDSVVVGSTGDDDKGEGSGSAYVFVRSGTTWTEQRKMTAGDGSANDAFGSSVSISGDTAVVGAPFEDPGAEFAGSAYLFVRREATWRQQLRLTAPDGGIDDVFGSSVAVDGDTAIVGAPGDGAGSAYVYTRSGTAWSQPDKVTSADGAGGDRFAASVGASGGTLALGAPNDDDRETDSGAAFVFTMTEGTWTEEARFHPFDGQSGDGFGLSVAIAGDTVVVGAPEDDDNGLWSGSAYVYVRTLDGWTQQAKLVASDGGVSHYFGSSVALSGDTVVVGAHLAGAGPDRPGAAYVFTRTGGSWSEQSKLSASDGKAGAHFGTSVAVSGDTAIVGAPDADGFHNGAAYVFARSGGSWSQQQKLLPAAASTEFGAAVAVDGATALVGAPADQNDLGWYTGAAHAYTRTGETWTHQGTLLPVALTERFGSAVSLLGDAALVGAPADDDLGTAAGAAFVFTRAGSSWSQAAKLVATDGHTDDRLGGSVGLSGDLAVVGASGDDDNGFWSGSAYLFSPANGVWREHAKLLPTDAFPGESWSTLPAAVDGGSAVIGVAHADINGIDSGAAYVFAVPPPPPVTTVNDAENWAEGRYPAGHTITITVTDSGGSTKASAVMATGPIEHFGGAGGYSTRVGSPWVPGPPDIAPGDFVHAVVTDSAAQPTGTVRVGEITGAISFSLNHVSGTIEATWLSDPVPFGCWTADNPGAVVSGLAYPASGYIYTCDFTLVGHDLDQDDEVWVRYQEPDGDRVVNVFALDPRVAIEKTTNGESYDAALTIGAGQPVTWTYVVTNTGNTMLYGLSVRDDNGTPADPSDDLTVACPQDYLLVGAGMTCSAAGVAQAGRYENRGTVTGKDQATNGDVTAVDTSTYFGVAAAVAVDTRTNGVDDLTAVDVGHPVAWTYLVTNTGTTDLTGITVHDDNGTPGDPSDDFPAACPTTSLSPGTAMTCTASGVAVAGRYENVGMVAGTGSAGTGAVTASDTSAYFGVVPTVAIDTHLNGADAGAAPGPLLAVGGPMMWTYLVTNTGNTDLSDVVVSDDNGTPGDPTDDLAAACPATVLSPAVAMTCTAADTVVEWSHISTATVTGRIAGRAAPVAASDVSYYRGVANVLPPQAGSQPTVGLQDPATGEWHLRDAAGSVTTFFFGNPGDVAFMGDWDCDGVDTPGLFRQSDAYAYLRNSNTQGIADIRFFFGNPSDAPLAGDFNGDGCDSLSIYRPSEQRFYIMNQLGANEGGLGAAEYSFVFGNPGDKPVTGDWDGDGATEVGLHRESTGFFYYRNSLTQGVADGEFFFGDPGDRFVAGDWNADGYDKPAVYRSGDTTFYFRHSLTQGIADASLVWGSSGWMPVSGHFSPG